MNCNFCGKHTDEVGFLITGPNVFICDECVDMASEIIAEEREKLANPPETSYEYDNDEDDENGEG